MTATLPITPLLPAVVAALREGRSLVLEAPPGAGKTTAVPPALLEAGVAGGEIVVLEPRRLAARLAARRVAALLGEPVGETVGYAVRHEDVGGPRTRLRFVTEGILLRRLLTEPTLPGVGTVVLDEFHERHLHGDLALALLAGLQRDRRPELRLVVMSATLEAAPIAAFLPGCRALRAEGRAHPVTIEHLSHPDDRPLADQVATAVRRLVTDGLDGDVLVFLPGAAEIARARDACAPIAARHDLRVAVLHGELPPAEQDRAITPADRPKIVLSTNVAETSVTIPGVVAVIDSGVARIASHDPWSGLPTLRVARISQASAAQRAGRAGRTRPGRCLRLYTRHDHDTRAPYDVPEVRRADLAEAALALHAVGVRDLASFSWFEPPEAAAIAAADALLARLGAIDRAGAVTPLGALMLRPPLHPRLARLVVEGDARGVLDAAAALAALVTERGLVAGGGRASARTSGPSDLVESLERFREAKRLGFAPGRLRSAGIEPGAAQAVERARRQIVAAMRRGGGAPRPGPSAASEDEDEALLVAILAGFPDRVGRRRGRGTAEVVLAAGGAAELDRASVVQDAELLVAVDVEERRTGTSRRAVIRAASAIRAEWLLDLFPGQLREERVAEWNAAAERVEIVARLRYDALVLDETRGPPAPEDADAAAGALADAALAAGPRAFVDGDALDRWLARVAFAAEAAPELGIVPPGVDDVRAALVDLCRSGRSWSFDSLRHGALLDALHQRLVPEHARQVAEVAPERVKLPGGRTIAVTYEPEKPPWIASKLQDFFGMRRGPAVARGRVPLVLHLLAPNGRAVQVTTDLAGFWSRHYPALRQQLARRYPRHAWPEDPLAASPPSPRR